MKNKSEADFCLHSQVPGQSRITDNPQCIRKQQYCCDYIDNVCAYASHLVLPTMIGAKLESTVSQRK